MKIDIFILAFKSEVFLNRLRKDLPEFTDNPHHLEIWDNEKEQRSITILKNTFAEKGNGDFILWANGDVLVTPHWDTKLIRFLEENPRFGAVLPLPVGDKRYPELWQAEVPPESLEPGLPSRERLVALGRDLEDLRGAHEVDGVGLFSPFFACFMRRKTWEETGGFDERLRMFGSDREYTIRMNREFNLAVGNVRSCPFYHGGGHSLGQGKKEEGGLDFEAEWAHRHTYFPAIEKGEMPRWNRLPLPDRAQFRMNPLFTHLALKGKS